MEASSRESPIMKHIIEVTAPIQRWYNEIVLTLAAKKTRRHTEDCTEQQAGRNDCTYKKTPYVNEFTSLNEFSGHNLAPFSFCLTALFCCAVRLLSRQPQDLTHHESWSCKIMWIVYDNLLTWWDWGNDIQAPVGLLTVLDY